jgi:hypothetical protein
MNANKRGSKTTAKFKPIYLFSDKLLQKAEKELNKPFINTTMNCGPVLAALMVIFIILVVYFKTH